MQVNITKGNKVNLSDAQLYNHAHDKLVITDVRDTNPTPAEVPGRTLSTFFNNQYGNTWMAGFTIAGWNPGTHQVMQLASPASNEDNDKLLYRVGLGANWGPWREILHSGNLPPMDYLPLTGGTLTGSLTVEGDKPVLHSGNWQTYIAIPSTEWSAILNKPETFPPSVHTQAWSTITGAPDFLLSSAIAAWAKAATKPVYTWEEIAEKPTTFTPAAHNQAWSTITGTPATFPPSEHTQAWSTITDAPTSFPASDVYAWAKAATKPSYTHTEVGAAAASHNHTKANITDFPTSLPASDVYAWAKASTPNNIDLSANNSIKLAVSGGTNLLQLAHMNPQRLSGYYYALPFSGNTYYNVSYSTLATARGKLPAGAYVLSWNGTVDESTSYSRIRISMSDDGSTYSTLSYVDMPKGLSTRRSFSFSLSASAYVGIQVYNHSFGAENEWNTYIQLEKIQLEKGTMATDWSPAPEDPAPSAIKLTNPRTLTIGSTGKTFDGSANVSWSLAEIGAQKKITYGTANPTGGVDGDIYIQY